ncbi:MAG TPA: hypothetical protein VKM54_25420 [Myxococcota bacterium]|nr:hypothetical protein [Myxococcota bacterium]
MSSTATPSASTEAASRWSSRRLDAVADWRVCDHLRRLAVQPDDYVEAPAKLGLGWLEQRLGIGAQAKRWRGWRIGRARRPS